MVDDDVLDLLKKYESRGRNVPNYMYDPKHTAQGFYQITNTNWNAYGPKVGVDLKKYPSAMAAPEEEQRKVARHLLTQTPLGVKNWKVSNIPKFQAELSKVSGPKKDDFIRQATPAEIADYEGQLRREGKLQDQIKETKVASPQQNTQQQDYSKVSDAELLDRLRKKYPDHQFDLPDTKTADKGQGKVEAPGMLGKWAGSGFGIKPAAEDIVKAFNDPDWRDKASDVLEAGGEVAPAMMAGSLLAAPFTGGLSSVLPMAAKMALGAGGSMLASGITDWLGGEANLDPKTRRLLTNIAGLGGGVAGYKGGVPATKAGVRGGYKLGTSPAFGGIAMAALARQLGIPEPIIAGYFGRNILPGMVEKMTPEFIKRWSGINKAAPQSPVQGPPSPSVPSTGPSTAAPTGTVKPPKVFVDSEYDKLAGEGHLPLDQYESHLRSNGVPEDIIQAKLTKAAKLAAAAAAKQKPPAVTLKPTPPMPPVQPSLKPPPQQMNLPGMEPQAQGPLFNQDTTPVTVPPGVQAEGPGVPPPGQGPQQLQLPFNKQSPQQMPLPGANVLQPGRPQPPLGGPIQQPLPFPPSQQPSAYQPELPFGPVGDPRQAGLQGVSAPFEPPKPPSPQPPMGTFGGPKPPLQLPVQPPPGSEVNPQNIQRQLPLGPRNITQEMPAPTQTRTEVNAMKIADAATKLGEDFSTSRFSWKSRKETADKLGLDWVPTASELSRAKRILLNRERATRRTASVPGS